MTGPPKHTRNGMGLFLRFVVGFFLSTRIPTVRAFHAVAHFPCPRSTSHVFHFSPIQTAACFLTKDHPEKNDDFRSVLNGPEAVRSRKPPTTTDKTHLQLLSFYHFTPLDPCLLAKFRDDLFEHLVASISGLRGTVYVATEGINAQLAVPPDQVDTVREICVSQLPVTSIDINLGDLVPIETPTFDRFVVRTRNAILRDGLQEHFGSDDPVELDWTQAGEELSPSEWDRQVKQQRQHQQDDSLEPILLDCRNDYETKEGSFVGAIPLKTNNFQESWKVLDELLSTTPSSDAAKQRPVYMFCTGGIRCVKVGAYVRQHLGFSNVKRLERGIIGYQRYIQNQKTGAAEEEVPSLWEGDNFVFDKRRGE